jgi:hypothetical protein
MNDKKFYISIVIIVFVFVIIMITSMLLDINFIQSRVVRQIAVYVFMLIEFYAGYRAVRLINS